MCLITNAFIIIRSRHPRYLKGFHDYGDILGYKAQVLDFVEVRKGLWFLETKQGFLFLVLKAQNHIVSRIFLTIHQLGLGKFHNPCGH